MGRGIAVYDGRTVIFPASRAHPAWQEAVSACRACDLFARATQGVFGEGAAHAELMLVGEQPGDQEDRAGRPFVGPAFRLTKHRGEILETPYASAVLATPPSSILRIPDRDKRHEARAALVKDLRTLVSALEKAGFRR